MSKNCFDCESYRYAYDHENKLHPRCLVGSIQKWSLDKNDHTFVEPLGYCEKYQKSYDYLKEDQ